MHPTKPAPTHKICLSADFLKLCYNAPALSKLLPRKRITVTHFNRPGLSVKRWPIAFCASCTRHFKNLGRRQTTSHARAHKDRYARIQLIGKNEKPSLKTISTSNFKQAVATLTSILFPNAPAYWHLMPWVVFRRPD